MSLPATLATRLARAHDSGTVLVSGSVPELRDAGVAWQVQRAGEVQRVAAGAVLSGWKVGYASEAMRREMGIAAPNYGPLYADMHLVSGARVGTGLTQPRVEPEIALVLADDVDAHLIADLPDADAHRVLSESVAQARCALEVVDSVWASYSFTWEENTADGSSAARAVLGDPIPAAADLSAVSLTIRGVDAQGNHTAYSGSGSAAMGHPISSLRWLVGALAESGRRLRAGDVVLTGGLTPTLPLVAGATLEAQFESPGWTGHVEVRR